MDNTNFANDLVERSKKIFKDLGLKDIDIKIFEDNNGEKTTQHIHVDENGATVDKGEASKATEEQKKRISSTVKYLTDWLYGEKSREELMGDLKEIFEDRCKSQLGDTSMKRLGQEIDRCAKTFFKDPFFGNLTDRMREIGVNINQEDINAAAEQLKALWGYSEKDDKKEKEADCGKCNGGTASSNQCTCKTHQKTKAEMLKESIDAEINELENEKHDRAIENSMKDAIIKLIDNRAFSLFDGEGEKNIGISMVIDFSNYAPKKETLAKLVEGAGYRVREEYGFSKVSVTPSTPAFANSWRLKFFF